MTINIPDLIPRPIRRLLNRPYTRELSAAEPVAPGKPAKRKRSLPAQLNRRAVLQAKMEVDELRAAIRWAEMPDHSNRAMLYAVYREVQRDDEVFSQLRTARIRLVRAAVEVYRGDVLDEDLTRELKSAWFGELLELLVDTEMWGHSLVELMPQADGRFTVELIPREHVQPLYGTISLDGTPFGKTGIGFRQNPDYPFLLEMGKPDDLGAYVTVALPAIRKRYSDSDWSLFSERFGMPLLSIKTAAQDSDEILKREEFAKNFGGAGYIITDDEDDIQMLSPNMVGTGHYVFRDRIDYADRQIAKLMNGQTGTSDEKAFVGSAEVHERVLDDYGFARLRRASTWCNDVLLPYMALFGLDITDLEIVFPELEQKDKEDGADTEADGGTAPDAPADPEDPQQPDRPGKPAVDKPKPGKSKSLSLAAGLEAHYGQPRRADEPEAVELALSRQDIDAWLKRTLALPAGEVDAEMFRQLLDGFLDEAGNGLAVDLRTLDAASSPVYAQLRESLVRFTTAKLFAVREDVELQTATGARTATARQHLRDWTEVENRAVLATSQTSKTYIDTVARDGEGQLMRYSTVRDRVVRPEHKALHGIVRPIGDAFWGTYWPPNGWNCRCLAEPVAGGLTDPLPALDDADVPAVFRGNPGRSGEYFAEHPYYDRLSAAKLDAATAKARATVDYLNAD